jgi:hypothetical protein
MRLRLNSVLMATIGLAGLILNRSILSAQDTVYAFTTKCFDKPQVSFSSTGANVTIAAKQNFPSDCVKDGAYSDQAIVLTYSKSFIDSKLAALTTDVNDLSAKAIVAIKPTVSENSVQAGQIDALVKSIEEKLYAKVLAQVKHDLAQSPLSSAPKNEAGKK